MKHPSIKKSLAQDRKITPDAGTISYKALWFTSAIPLEIYPISTKIFDPV